MIDIPFTSNVVLVLIDGFGIWLALWVYFASKKERLNRGFSLMVISILSWVTFYHLTIVVQSRFELSLTLFRLATASVFLFFIAYYFFIVRWFLDKKGLYKILGIFVSVYGFVFALIAIFTEFIIATLKFEKLVVIPVFSSWGWFIFYGYVIVLTILINAVLLANYFTSPKETKLKIKYFLVGLLIFAVLNLIFNVILQVFLKVYRFYQFGNYSAIFLLGFTAYAIVKQELFGIRVVLTTLFVGLIAILLFLDALVFTQSFPLQIIKGSILLMFLAFGYSLIQSVLREIKLREELQAAYQKLDELDKAKSEFISIASHQLRTPLTAIKGYVSMILGGSYGKVDQKSKQPLENVYKSSQRLINLVNDLLSISKIEAGKMELEIERGSLEEIVMSVFEELKIEAEKKKIYLKWEKPKMDLPDIFIDTDKIRQVILNLIDNDIKYTSKGGITMKAETINNDIKIMISDTGEGMTKEELAKIFSSFSRGEAGTQLFTEGAGLGLYVARKFVEMHQGRIWAESKGKGKGSQFFIILPIFRESLRQFLKDM